MAFSEWVKEEILLVEVRLGGGRRRGGGYFSYTELEKGEVRIGDSDVAPMAQRRFFEIDRADVGRICTDLYITGHKNHYVKIRSSHPERGRVAAERAVAPVLNALGEMLGSQALNGDVNDQSSPPIQPKEVERRCRRFDSP